jgi:hypothetical protein
MKLNVLLEQKKIDDDFGNYEGWSSNVELVWPEAEITKVKFKFFAKVENEIVGEWDIKANKGFIQLSDN